MKKCVMILACLMTLGMQSMKAEPVIVALHHQGNVTFYYDYQFDAAQNDAVEGDTIYLSEGTFLGDIGIRKAIHIIGAGQSTIIKGNVDIWTNEMPNGYLLENMNIEGELYMHYCSPVGLRIRKIRAEQFYMLQGRTGEGVATDTFVDKCQFKAANFGAMINASYVNCKIGQVYGSSAANAVQLINCNVKTVEDVRRGTFINCIISGPFEGSATNCLIYTPDSERFYLDNCYSYDKDLFDDNMECTISNEELAQYLGTDGTIVGCYGGETPFTLKTTTPRVLEKTVTLDKAAKKLNVNITVGTE